MEIPVVSGNISIPSLVRTVTLLRYCKGLTN